MNDESPTELAKGYEHREVEARWYRVWKERGYFHADETDRSGAKQPRGIGRRVAPLFAIFQREIHQVNPAQTKQDHQDGVFGHGVGNDASRVTNHEVTLDDVRW